MVGADREEFRQYLARIGMGAPLVERAATMLDRVLRFLPDEPEFLFVSDSRDDEGNRNYSSMWVLTPTILSEVKEFVSQDKFDFMRRDRKLARVEVSDDDFDFAGSQDGSRLSVFASFTEMSATLEASGSNCLDLQEILTDYLLPTLYSDEG